MIAKGKVFRIVLQALHASDLLYHVILRFTAVNIHIFSTSCTPKRDHASLFSLQVSPCMESDEGGQEEEAVICKEV